MTKRPTGAAEKTEQAIATTLADALRPLRAELDAIAREQKHITAALDMHNIQLKDLREEVKTLFAQYAALTSAIKLLEDEVSKWRV